MKQQRIIIVGGGYAGTTLARSLDGVAEVSLIEQRDRFFHTFPALRAVTNPDEWLPRIMIPYSNLLDRGVVIQDRVTAVDEQSVQLASGKSIEGDIIILATGSNYVSPFKPRGESFDDYIAQVHSAHQQLLGSQSIAVVGGGASGVELAGELSSAFRDKQVTMVSSQERPMIAFPEKLGQRVKSEFLTMGIDYVGNSRAEGLQCMDGPSSGSFKLGGQDFQADTIFPVVGARPDSGLLKALPNAVFDSAGCVEVDIWLRPAGCKNIFALGDVAATGDAMTAFAITARQAPWLAKLIKKLLKGANIEKMAAYKPFYPQPISVALGPENGVGYLPFLGGLVVGKGLVVKGKSRDMMASRAKADMRYEG